MILIKNQQRKIVLDTNELKRIVSNIIDALKYPDFSIGIMLTNNKNIQSYNKTYRNIDKPTDILSFAYYPDLIAGKRIKAKEDEDKNLGDLIISLEYVKKHAQELQISFEERMKIILVHGICHLLGYDHIKDSDYRRMRAKEAWILKKIK